MSEEPPNDPQWRDLHERLYRSEARLECCLHILCQLMAGQEELLRRSAESMDPDQFSALQLRLEQRANALRAIEDEAGREAIDELMAARQREEA